MKSTVQDREFDRFRPAESNKSKVAVVVEQDVYTPVPVELDVQDSFNRLKVAPPHLLFDSSFQYSLQTKVFIQSTTLGGSVTHNANRAAAVLSCTSTAGSRARFRSRNYFPYSPAFTNTITGSFRFNGTSSTTTKRVGLYDDKNGFILEASESTLKVAIRSSINGSPVENYASKASWNIDTFDGSGGSNNPSGILLDPSKQLIFYIEYQWLGSGKVEFGFLIGLKRYPAHKFFHSNLITSLYSQTGSLPVQAEIIGGGVSDFMEFTCCSVVSNGSTAQHGHLHSASTGATPRSLPTTGVSYPIISLRKKPGFTNIPVQILDMVAFSTSSDDFIVQIVHKPTLTGAVWIDIPNTFSQKDVSSTSWTGGDIVAEFYMKGNLQASQTLEAISRFWDLTLGDDFIGNSEIMTMTATPLTNNANLFGVISFKEFE
jgi:hypothetical protein